MSNEKAIIEKLLVIATKQQKVIHKLAQDDTVRYQSARERHSPGNLDPNISYLKGVVDAAAPNAGVTTPVGADVKANAGSQEGGARIEATYSVSVRGLDQADEKTKENFLKVYKNQIKAQRPALDGKVSIFFV